MKTISALFLAAGMAGLPALSQAAGEMGDTAKKVSAMPTRGAEMARPHFKATGKPVSAARGEVVYIDHCAVCHGLHGKGDGPRSAFFVPGQQYIADLSNAQFVRGRDDQLLNSIREGLNRYPEPAYAMPQFKYILSDEEIRSVLVYVKTLPSHSTKK